MLSLSQSAAKRSKLLQIYFILVNTNDTRKRTKTYFSENACKEISENMLEILIRDFNRHHSNECQNLTICDKVTKSAINFIGKKCFRRDMIMKNSNITTQVQHISLYFL